MIMFRLSHLTKIKSVFSSAGVKAIEELMKHVDEEIPTPVRELDKPFCLSVEGVYSIAGKGKTNVLLFFL